MDNSDLLEGDVADATARLKEEDGPELQVHGSSNLIQTLLQHNLIDEFRVWIFPVVLGSGKRLFAEGTLPAGLALVDSRTSTTASSSLRSRLQERRGTRRSLWKSRPRPNSTKRPPVAQATGEPRRLLLDQRLDLIALVDDDVSIRLLDHLLDFLALVTRHHGKAVALAADVLILAERHQDMATTRRVPSALAPEFKLVLRRRPGRCALIDRGDLLVDGAQQAFVPSLPLQPFVHRRRTIYGRHISGDAASAMRPRASSRYPLQIGA